MPNVSGTSYGSPSASYAHGRTTHTAQPSSIRKSDTAWSLTIAERRASPRVETHLSTVVHCEGRKWKGESRSIGLGGMALVLVGEVPALLNQQIRLSFVPRLPVSTVLELYVGSGVLRVSCQGRSNPE